MNATTQRIISATILIPLFVICLYYPKAWAVLTICMAVGMVIEFFKICDHPLYLIFVSLYIMMGCYAFYEVRRAGGFNAALWAFVSIWISDSAAYFGGRFFKGPKLAPFISPNKTLSGLLVGIGVGVLASTMLSYQLNLNYSMWMISLLLIIGHLGDLMESWIKRRLGVKDTSALIPGHGGIFDRMDSCLSFFIIFYIIMSVL
jgi:phosphatidate cytidylyltransferase